MRDSLVKAIRSGAVTALGTHRVVLGGATVDADIYQVGDQIHLEIDCNKQTLSTRLGQIQADGVMHLQMDVDTYRSICEKAQGIGPKLAAAAEWLTKRSPLLRDRSDG